MKKIASLFILIAIAGLVSINSYAHSFDHYGFGGFGPFGYGYAFGGFGYGMDYAAFGGFGHEMDFGGFGYGMDYAAFGYSFASFDGFNHDFTAHTAVPNSIRKIVPIPATASATNTSITYDEDGNIHVRPFDDEDLFVED
ncbi:MAG: hypothetical protein J6T46_09265 [Victivallales bacterium]|nr:hypothetical protein [Victivallales bacterium]